MLSAYALMQIKGFYICCCCWAAVQLSDWLPVAGGVPTFSRLVACPWRGFQFADWLLVPGLPLLFADCFPVACSVPTFGRLVACCWGALKSSDWLPVPGVSCNLQTACLCFCVAYNLQKLLVPGVPLHIQTGCLVSRLLLLPGFKPNPRALLKTFRDSIQNC